MKKNKTKYIIIVVLIAVFAFIIYAYQKQQNGESLFLNSNSETVKSTTTTSEASTTTSNVEASIQTLTNTLDASGEITSALTEQLQLHATYYYSEIYYSEGDYVEEGKNILKYSNGTYLVAPYDLVIKSISVPAEGGECTNKNYIEVESTDTLTLSASISEDDLSKLSVGQNVQIAISALEGKEYTGYVTKISETGKYSSNGSNFTVTITLENDGNIKIGMSASCEIILEKAENAVTVPKEAVQTSGDSKYVVIVKNDGTTENVTVTTGISNDAYTEIKSGLTGTETVQITETTKTKSSFGGMTGNGPSQSSGNMGERTSSGTQSKKSQN